jgi:hypothetical protein
MSAFKYKLVELSSIISAGNTAWAIATTPPPTLKEIKKMWEEEMRQMAQEVIDSQT